MLAALCTSAAFLASYLYYHAHVGHVLFQGHGWSRPLYFSILLSHTILAVIIVPLVLVTLSRALRARYALHKAIARWTFPLWMYVSVTGVVIYLMLLSCSVVRTDRARTLLPLETFCFAAKLEHSNAN